MTPIADVYIVISRCGFVKMSLENTWPGVANYTLAASYNHSNFFEKFEFFEVRGCILGAGLNPYLSRFRLTFQVNVLI